MITAMDAIDKIRKFMAVEGMNAAQFVTLSAIAKSAMSGLLARKQSLSLNLAQRAARAMSISLDDLLNESLDWPLPERVDPGRLLTSAESMVLGLAREVSGDDPELKEAKRRLLLMGYTRTSSGSQADPPSP